ncbi:extracellular solute-binding protein [Myxococcus sp. Y35]|uniref:extracellular solute-binding protein n=1 Tax=Pseudomyxococcus flavus TaxID=3115648 RepID=UPI003CE87A88
MDWRALPCVLALCLGACSEPSDPEPQDRRPLKAVLFPYIPDAAGDGFASLEQRLEADFERDHPDIDLDVVFDANLDVYDLEEGGVLNQLLGQGAGAAQVVEIDTLILGALVAKGWVQPVALESGAAHPAAEEAVSISGQSYGVPTYLCSYVVYSHSANLAFASDGASLVQVLSDVAPGVRPLAANYSGSWTLPSSYLDAWADTNPEGELSQALSLPLDATALDSFEEVVKSCELHAGANPCLDGTFADNTLPEEAFATGQANGFMGYTERLFFARRANPSMALPGVISVPLGTGSAPAVFVDALVVSARCTGTCAEDAQAFTDFMKDPAVRSLIAFSGDAPQGTSPRYLLQASEAFYQQEPALSDPMYQQYRAFLDGARPYPNQGFPENRRTLQSALMNALQ